MDILNTSSKRGREIERFSVELRKYPKDLFHRFLPSSPNTTLHRHASRQSPEPEKLEDGEEELNLGLSLGGRFGVDRSHKGLVRSSSVAAALPLARAEDTAAAAAAAALVRTASLPPATEEEWVKRKELQSLRRMEAKRKRSSRNGLPGQPGRADPGSGYPKSGFCRDLQGPFRQQDGSQGSSGDSQGESLSSDPGLPGKANPGSGYPKSGFCVDLQDPGSQRSTVSQGASKSSSNASENERNTVQGARTGEVSSTKKLESLENEKISSRGGENGMGNMPCVFTIGDGPKGRKVEGILYRYKKGEEVRIMCICHGSFFTPAEFVSHAGGQNVAHPLKRIVVNPNASPFS